MLTKSTIGKLMITSRKAGSQLSIEGGTELCVDQLAVDAQDSDPVYGSPIRISGGEGITLSNMSIKGAMSDPASATGGTAANRGWIHVSGGKQILVQGCTFSLAGPTPAPATTPLLYAASAVGANQVRWGLNNYAKFAGAQAKLVQAATGKIYAIPDPNVAVSVG